MRLMRTIRFKPKSKYLDDFLAVYEEVTKRALEDGSIDQYFTAIAGDEVIYVGTFNELESDKRTIERGLGWLDKYAYMLHKYSEDEGFARIETGTIKFER